MRRINRKCATLVTMVMIALLSSFGSSLFAFVAAGGDQHLGRWEGTWKSRDGMAGTFVMTIERQADEKLGGSISVEMGGSPLYEESFTEVTVDGDKLTAKYPNSEGIAGTVVIEGTLNEKAGSGTYSMMPEGATQSYTGGTWEADLK